MNFLQFIQENESGKVSASRLLLLIWGVGIFGVWAMGSCQAKMLLDIPDSVVTVLGLLGLGKTVQRFGESSSSSSLQSLGASVSSPKSLTSTENQDTNN